MDGGKLVIDSKQPRPSWTSEKFAIIPVKEIRKIEKNILKETKRWIKLAKCMSK